MAGPFGNRNAFTLIELLVVIAIIAALAAILFPVIVKAKDRARIAACQSHQKELADALMLYTDDYDGRLPRVQFLSSGGYGKLFCEPYVKNRAILVCPATFIDPQPLWLPPVRNMGFAYNQHCLCDTDLVKVSLRHTDIYATRRALPDWVGRPMGSIVLPSRTPAFFCAESVHTVSGGPQGTIYVGFGWEPKDAFNGGRMVNAHCGGANYTFLDCHTKWLRPAPPPLYQATAGLDYDGNGTLGDNETLR